MDTTQNENISRWKDSLGLNEEADRKYGHIAQPSQKPRDLKDEQTPEILVTFDEYWASAPTSLYPPPSPDNDRKDGYIDPSSYKRRDLKNEQTLEIGLTFEEYWASAPTSLFPPPFSDSSPFQNSPATFQGFVDSVTPENDLTFGDLEMSWPASLNNGPTFSFDNESANIKDPQNSSQSVPLTSHVPSSLSTGVEESISNRVPPREAAPWDKSTSSSLKRQGKRPLKYEDRRQAGQTRSVGACSKFSRYFPYRWTT